MNYHYFLPNLSEMINFWKLPVEQDRWKNPTWLSFRTQLRAFPLAVTQNQSLFLHQMSGKPQNLTFEQKREKPLCLPEKNNTTPLEKNNTL